MQKKFESSAQDTFICPLTGKPFRHPILASDGHHYELKALLNRLNAGYTNGYPGGAAIFFASYDLPLRNELDERDIPKRHEEYERQPCLEQLTEKLSAPYKPWKQDVYKALLTADSLMLMVAALCYFKDSNALSADGLLLLMLTSSLLDFAIRQGGGHQYGIGGILQKLPRFIRLVGEAVSTAYDPDEHESVFRL
ncbi:hypothetical protein [Legionella erythra]|uniref:U-box domain protein n=1 Tax=Legionella erythra TaxID=448 RepID=A0A0W0TRW4_LEGER|nr:hypothetical protein [Legionella erythra]KTC98417.1 hypothetical protein Lery_0885 [Legionella erythra]